MDASMVYFIIAIIIFAGIIGFVMWKGGKYTGRWIIYGAAGGQLGVYRTKNDARSDGRETLQFHLEWFTNEEGEQIKGNDCITIIPTHWIGRMDKISDK